MSLDPVLFQEGYVMKNKMSIFNALLVFLGSIMYIAITVMCVIKLLVITGVIQQIVINTKAYDFILLLAVIITIPVAAYFTKKEQG